MAAHYRGSLNKFMLGAKNCKNFGFPSLYNARASSLMAAPISRARVVLKEALNAMGCGNTVAGKTESATPWRHSVPQLNAGMPSRSIAGVVDDNRDPFSESERRKMRSETLSGMGSEVLRQGSIAATVEKKSNAKCAARERISKCRMKAS